MTFHLLRSIWTATWTMNQAGAVEDGEVPAIAPRDKVVDRKCANWHVDSLQKYLFLIRKGNTIEHTLRRQSYNQYIFPYHDILEYNTYLH